MPFAKIEDAVAAIARGEIVVVVDDEDRENEGDLIMAAEFATPEKIAFFLHHTSGVHLRADHRASGPRELDLPLMVAQNTESQRTAFLVTRRLPPRHHHRHLRLRPRAPPSRRSCDPATRPGDLARPGHILPLEAREGGVLKRAGHTEATIDLVPHGRPLPGRRAVRDRRRQEDGHGPRARARALRRRARPAA